MTLTKAMDWIGYIDYNQGYGNTCFVKCPILQTTLKVVVGGLACYSRMHCLVSRLSKTLQGWQFEGRVAGAAPSCIPLHGDAHRCLMGGSLCYS